MPKKKDPSWYTLTHQSGGYATIPMNRKARRIYKKKNKQLYMLPPVLMPYVKPKKEE